MILLVADAAAATLHARALGPEALGFGGIKGVAPDAPVHATQEQSVHLGHLLRSYHVRIHFEIVPGCFSLHIEHFANSSIAHALQLATIEFPLKHIVDTCLLNCA